jgi:hypothetical protein
VRQTLMKSASTDLINLQFNLDFIEFVSGRSCQTGGIDHAATALASFEFQDNFLSIKCKENYMLLDLLLLLIKRRSESSYVVFY